ncbi:hypothetical protein QLL95_gp0621 [Cotonvirus japonicus]|uniref:Uncharacterized protein n=1 Tax=Cotonvirus japonicus TaxID=2811091 RepID=A0ABM7NTJ9_9VIRU|nr:hypothetical protein QLL95_gp0621 [Cotonvirus japonicus]BCS83502.1 hypothetical protein [Cotonvirus japonicus]
MNNTDGINNICDSSIKSCLCVNEFLIWLMALLIILFYYLGRIVQYTINKKHENSHDDIDDIDIIDEIHSESINGSVNESQNIQKDNNIEQITAYKFNDAV